MDGQSCPLDAQQISRLAVLQLTRCASCLLAGSCCNTNCGQPDNGTGCFCQLSLLPWVCRTFSKLVYLWAVCCIRLLVLNSSWPLLVGFAEQQFCNAAPAGTLAVQKRCCICKTRCRADVTEHVTIETETLQHG